METLPNYFQTLHLPPLQNTCLFVSSSIKPIMITPLCLPPLNIFPRELLFFTLLRIPLLLKAWPICSFRLNLSKSRVTNMEMDLSQELDDY